VRARCGNSISERRKGPVAALDPPELDDFVVPLTSEGSMDWLAEESDRAWRSDSRSRSDPQVFAAADARMAPQRKGDSDGLFGGMFAARRRTWDRRARFGETRACRLPASCHPPASCRPATFLPPDGGATSGAPEPDRWLSLSDNGDDRLAVAESASKYRRPAVLWLVACGVIGLAARSWRPPLMVAGYEPETAIFDA
jgi:hypothetical protein